MRSMQDATECGQSWSGFQAPGTEGWSCRQWCSSPAEVGRRGKGRAMAIDHDFQSAANATGPWQLRGAIFFRCCDDAIVNQEIARVYRGEQETKVSTGRGRFQRCLPRVGTTLVAYVDTVPRVVHSDRQGGLATSGHTPCCLHSAVYTTNALLLSHHCEWVRQVFATLTLRQSRECGAAVDFMTLVGTFECECELCLGGI